MNYTHQAADFIDFRQTPTLQKMLTRNGPVIAQGDFNGDQLADIVLGGTYRGSPTLVYYQQPNGNFVPKDTLPTASITVGDIAVLDINQDGFQDIFLVPGVSERPITAEKAYQPLLFLGTKNGFALDEGLPDLAICSESILLADFNSDGFTDLLLGGSYLPNAYPNHFRSVLLTVKEGKISELNAPWLPNHIAIKDMIAFDVDNDGDKDILLTGHWESLKLLRNNGTTYTLEETNLPKGWWNCLQAADLDGDGDLDVVLGNEGLNTVYKATPEQPVTLLAKDFNGDGRIDPIFGTFLANKEVAVHPLGTLTEQIAQFKKRFTQFKLYATTDLQQLFTPTERQDAQQWQVTELRSGIAINDGKGNFTFQPLPCRAASPHQDLLLHDFNADGILDLLLISNFYPNESIFGQSDASFGNLLLGKGNLAFELYPLIKSGLCLDGDMRKSLLIPQQKLLLVTQNQGEVLTFSF
ncbi:MAG: VCBS repeat-containing protein [Saprospiraceae bacterium]|nr:VCBS repeat-containing protein [Saprospiraceae bacterium]